MYAPPVVRAPLNHPILSMAKSEVSAAGAQRSPAALMDQGSATRAASLCASRVIGTWITEEPRSLNIGDSALNGGPQTLTRPPLRRVPSGDGLAAFTFPKGIG
jgi:hypothetical protein